VAMARWTSLSDEEGHRFTHRSAIGRCYQFDRAGSHAFRALGLVSHNQNWHAKPRSLLFEYHPSQ